MLLPLLLSLATQSTPPSDWVIPAGSTVIYDTSSGPVRVNSLTVEAGAYLRLLGPEPFLVIADSHVDATLQLRGAIAHRAIDPNGLLRGLRGSLRNQHISITQRLRLG